MKPKLRARGEYIPKRPGIVTTTEATLQEGLRWSGYITLSKGAMMATVETRSGRAPHVVKSVAAGPQPVLRPTDAGIELRYCSTCPVQDLLGWVRPTCKWSRSRKQQAVRKSPCVVMLVTETESEAVVYVRPPGRSRRSTPHQGKQEAKQETKQASKGQKKRRNRNECRKEESAEEEEEEEDTKIAER